MEGVHEVHDLIDHIGIIVYPGGIQTIKIVLFSPVTLLRMLLTFWLHVVISDQV